MKINLYLLKTACPPSSGTLLPDHRFGVFAQHIARAALLLPVALGATVVLATGCSSTGAGYARLIMHLPQVVEGKRLLLAFAASASRIRLWALLPKPHDLLKFAVEAHGLVCPCDCGTRALR